MFTFHIRRVDQNGENAGVTALDYDTTLLISMVEEKAHKDNLEDLLLVTASDDGIMFSTADPTNERSRFLPDYFFTNETSAEREQFLELYAITKTVEEFMDKHEEP